MPTRTIPIEISHGEKTCDDCIMIKVSCWECHDTGDTCLKYNEILNDLFIDGKREPYKFLRCQACLDDEANENKKVDSIV